MGGVLPVVTSINGGWVVMGGVLPVVTSINGGWVVGGALPVVTSSPVLEKTRLSQPSTSQSRVPPN